MIGINRLGTVTLAAILGVTLAAGPAVAVSEAQADRLAVPLREAVAALAVANEVRDGYERDKFRHWSTRTRTAATRAPRF